MKRTMTSTIIGLTLCTSVPVLAADYPEYPDLRPAYDQSWENPDDSIRFEFGTAYWYSWGGQDATIPARAAGIALGDITVSSRDITHIGELHAKIEDLSTQTYLNVKAGLGLNTTGTYDISPAASGSIDTGSRIGYAGADFGWLPLGTMTNGAAFGGLIGYQYWKDAPEIGSGLYATSFAGGVPASFSQARNDLDIHALRLGIKGMASYDMFDIQAEVAAVPYANLYGTLGGSSPNGFTLPLGTFYERAPTTFSGRGYGVMAETMVGFHPTENLALRVGGRAWYLEGKVNTNLTTNVDGAVNLPSALIENSVARYFRYGLMAELTGRF